MEDEETEEPGQDLSGIIDLDQYATTNEDEEKQTSPKLEEEAKKKTTIQSKFLEANVLVERTSKTLDKSQDEAVSKELESESPNDVLNMRREEEKDSPEQSLIPLGQRITETDPWSQLSYERNEI